jgi:uncharacterized membrane protein
MKTKNISSCLSGLLILIIICFLSSGAFAFFGGKFKTLEPSEGQLSIPVNSVSDGKAHYFTVKAGDGIHVNFFVVMSSDGVIRAAVDACDVCYRSGKGYIQEGESMVCTNCGRHFALNKINEVKGGCNPGPLERSIEGDNLVISMKEINANSWYFKK